MNDTPLISIEPSTGEATLVELRSSMTEAVAAWLTRSPSMETREAYTRELHQFRCFVGIAENAWEELSGIRPSHVAGWRDQLLGNGLTNTAVARKLSVIRSMYGYLRAFGYTGANPADTKYVASPTVPRDGKSVALAPEDCRRLLDSPSLEAPEGIRDRAILAVLAYGGIRVGELCRLRVEDSKSTGGHKVLEVRGKGGKVRRILCTQKHSNDWTHG